MSDHGTTHTHTQTPAMIIFSVWNSCWPAWLCKCLVVGLLAFPVVILDDRFPTHSRSVLLYCIDPSLNLVELDLPVSLSCRTWSSAPYKYFNACISDQGYYLERSYVIASICQFILWSFFLNRNNYLILNFLLIFSLLVSIVPYGIASICQFILWSFFKNIIII